MQCVQTYIFTFVLVFILIIIMLNYHVTFVFCCFASRTNCDINGINSVWWHITPISIPFTCSVLSYHCFKFSPLSIFLRSPDLMHLSVALSQRNTQCVPPPPHSLLFVFFFSTSLGQSSLALRATFDLP